MEKAKKQKQEPLKTSIKLTQEQIAQLTGVFGTEIVTRLETIEIEQLAGYLRANAKVN